jgi:hypothetical protein
MLKLSPSNLWFGSFKVDNSHPTSTPAAEPWKSSIPQVLGRCADILTVDREAGRTFNQLQHLEAEQQMPGSMVMVRLQRP